MDSSTIVIIVVAVIGSNALQAFVNNMFGKKRAQADTSGAIVESAIKLSTFAMEHTETSNQRYSVVAEHLELCEMHLAEARKQLIYEKEHNAILTTNCNILQDHKKELETLLTEQGIEFTECPRLLVMRGSKNGDQ